MFYKALWRRQVEFGLIFLDIFISNWDIIESSVQGLMNISTCDRTIRINGTANYWQWGMHLICRCCIFPSILIFYVKIQTRVWHTLIRPSEIWISRVNITSYFLKTVNTRKLLEASNAPQMSIVYKRHKLKSNTTCTPIHDKENHLSWTKLRRDNK